MNMSKLFKTLMLLLNNERGSLDLTGSGGNLPSDSTVPDGGESSSTGGENLDAGEPSPIDFPTDLDEDIANDPSLKVFIQDNKINYGNLMKSYVHAQRKMGQKGTILPDKTSSEEDWNSFYNQLRPSDLEEYKLNPSLAEGQELDQEFHDGFRAIAHKSGLSAKQAEQVLAWQHNRTKEINDVSKQKEEAAYQDEVKGLRAEWGEGFDNEFNLAKRAMKEFIGDDEGLLKAVNDSGMSTSVPMIRLMNKIGKSLMQEDNLLNIENHSNFNMTPQQAEAKIAKIMGDKSNPYWDANHAEHKFVVEEVQKLMAMQNPA